jgi:hypothetical protein
MIVNAWLFDCTSRLICILVGMLLRKSDLNLERVITDGDEMFMKYFRRTQNGQSFPEHAVFPIGGQQDGYRVLARWPIQVCGSRAETNSGLDSRLFKTHHLQRKNT